MFDRLASRAAHLLGRRCGLYLLRVTSRPVHAFSAEAVAEVRCGMVGEAELRRWCADPAMELRLPAVRAALARGDVCIGAWQGEVPVGYQWLAFAAAPHVAGIWVQFDERDCYAYKKLVLPAYRGRRIAALLSAQADDIAAAKGRERVLSLIAVDNTTSWKAARRTRSESVGYVGFLRGFRLSFPFHSDGARDVGMSLFVPPASGLPLPETA
jgi:GNAT superfamily N-acetyltransferase